MPVELTCGHCGASFKAKSSDTGRKYCSFACYKAHEAEHGRPTRIAPRTTFSCKQCGKPFERSPGELRSYHKQFGKDPLYCSLECSAIGRRYTADMWHGECVQCGKRMELPRRPGGTINRNRKICSSECRKAFKLAEQERLRPSAERQIQRRINRDGYVVLRFPNVNGTKGREVLEHRYVMEQFLGRTLLPAETVHHKLPPRTRNELDNLELRAGNHGPGHAVTDIVAWSIEMLTTYADFARRAGFKLVKLPNQA